MTSYQDRKQEIRDLERKVERLEQRLNESGIEFGQLSIDDVKHNLEKDEYGLYINQPGYRESRADIDVANAIQPQPPAPPLARRIKEGCRNFCKECGSSTERSGFLGLIGKRYCINLKCINSKL